MNYYEHHLGDYMRDTVHLSVLEDGIYRRLLDQYYIRERPLPLDHADCCKLARAASRSERDAVGYVLREYFEQREDGYHQPRADAEIARFKDKQRKASASANARWQKSERNANACEETMRTHCEGNAPRARPQTPDSRQEQKQQGASTDVEALTRSDPVPIESIVAAYNATMERLPKVRVLTAKRRQLIRSAWQAAPQFRSLDFWRAYFAECADDHFLNGTGPYTNGHENWRPDLDYLLRQGTVAKVFELAVDRAERAA